MFERAGSILSAGAGSRGEGRTILPVMTSSSQLVSIYQQELRFPQKCGQWEKKTTQSWSLKYSKRERERKTDRIRGKLTKIMAVAPLL